MICKYQRSTSTRVQFFFILNLLAGEKRIYDFNHKKGGNLLGEKIYNGDY